MHECTVKCWCDCGGGKLCQSVFTHLFGSLHGITGGVSDLRGRLSVDLIVKLKQKKIKN